uniref:DUF7869 domain-containing protein n=1 Tax=Cuerna arida TaxID=1464854 RepID=A0A1B6EQE5_9HEMI
MFLWNESITGRGSNEIASCFLKALNNGITHKIVLNVGSDNCFGQNKNKMIFFSYYLVSFEQFNEINTKFLVPGHSLVSCDRDFALIEKRKCVEKCETPMDLVSLIANANRQDPYSVTLMAPEDYVDSKNIPYHTIPYL